MNCIKCGKKLNIFSDYKNIKIDGEKKDICRKCFNKIEKQEIQDLLKTDEGRVKVGVKGYVLIIAGLIEILLGLLSLYAAIGYFQIFTIIMFIFGVFTIVKGSHLKKISKIKI